MQLRSSCCSISTCWKPCVDASLTVPRRMSTSSTASLPFTANLDQILSTTVPRARLISGISTAYATWLNGVDTMVSQHCSHQYVWMSWWVKTVKTIWVGHCDVDVTHRSQDQHDMKLLTCRWRLTDHDAKMGTPMDAQRRLKLDR